MSLAKANFNYKKNYFYLKTYRAFENYKGLQYLNFVVLELYSIKI